MKSLLNKTIQTQMNQEYGAFSHRYLKLHLLIIAKFLLQPVKKDIKKEGN